MEIEIINYPVSMRLGCFTSERIAPQDILISLCVFLDTDFDQDSKEYHLKDTLDYGNILAFIDNLLKDTHIELMEVCLNKIGSGLLSNFRGIRSATVSVEKPIIPHHINCGAQVRVKKLFKRDGDYR